MISPIELKSELSERVKYNVPSQPMYLQRGRLSSYENLSAVSHWHTDVEFLVPLAGHLAYNVNGRVLSVGENEGIFVNSRQLHYGFSADGTDCRFLCILLHPVLLCANEAMGENFVSPVLRSAAFSSLILDPEIKWQGEILRLLRRIDAAQQRQDPELPLAVQADFYRIWALLYAHLPAPAAGAAAESAQLVCLKTMVGFIQKNYAEKLSLAQIAQAGHVCQSSCCTVFRALLHQTPGAYLTAFRLSKAMELLRGSDISVTEIAEQIGFSGASYFAETFRRHLSCTPGEFRARCAAELRKQ
jgi:AraC-like DNA-binding protein